MHLNLLDKEKHCKNVVRADVVCKCSRCVSFHPKKWTSNLSSFDLDKLSTTLVHGSFLAQFLFTNGAGWIQDFGQGAQQSFDPRRGPEPKICSKKLPENCMILKISWGAGPPLDPLVW